MQKEMLEELYVIRQEFAQAIEKVASSGGGSGASLPSAD